MDERTLEEYVWQNRAGFYRLAYAYVHNEPDALDVVSDAIVKALEQRHKLRDRDALKPWFCRIVVHTALDTVRRRQRVQYDDELLPEPQQNDSYADLGLHQALERLPEQYRTVVLLRFFEELSLEEVAATLRLNLNTTKTRLYRALELLRKDIGAEYITIDGRPVAWTSK